MTDGGAPRPDPGVADRPGSIHVLLRAPLLARLVMSLFVFRLGGAMTMVALPLLVIDRYGLGLSAGFTLGVRLLPNILLGALVGNVVDRLQPRRVAIGSALASAATVAMFPFTSALWQVQVLSFVSGVVYMFGYPARIALRPLVIGEGQEVQGNSLVVTAERLSGLLGPACAGAVIAGAGLTWVFGVEAITAVGAATLMVGLPDRPPQPESPETAGAGLLSRIRSLTAGGFGELIAIVRRDAMVKALVFTAFTYVAATAVGEILVTAYSLAVFPSVVGGNGYLMAAMGVGGVIGGVLAGHLSRLHQGRLYLAGNVVEGLTWLILPTVAFLPAALAVLAAAGLLESLATVVYFAECQKRLPQRYSGRFYGVFIPLTDVCVMVGTIAAAPLAGHAGVGWSAVVVCLAIVLPVLAFAGTFMGRRS